MEEKALAMFEFINAYINLREKKITNLQNEHWYKFLKDISGLEGIKINYQDEDSNPIFEGDRLLSVKGQAVIKCPEPNILFASWLSIGWDNYNYKCEHINELNNNDTETKERFEDNKERVAKYEAWKIKRDNWAEKGKIIAKVNDFYGKLRRINETIKNENKQEILIADGVLVAKAHVKDTVGKIIDTITTNYPLLLKKAKIDFDAKSNTVFLENTDDTVELYTDIFEGFDFDNISLENIKKYEIEARTKFLNPWDAEGTKEFFNLFVNEVCTNGQGQYIGDQANKDTIIGSFAVYKKPLILLRNKKTGVKQIVKEIIDDIHSNGIKSGAIKDLFGDKKPEEPVVKEKTIEQILAATSGDSLDILLAEKANKEQLEIAEKIETSNGVLVQGPPGTGKTHTIANLIGHFIAQGKTVLVTSEKEKALTVVKEKLPEPVQKLCVALIGNNKKDMENSIEGMLEYRGKHSQYDELKRMKGMQEERKDYITRINTNRKAIYASRLKSHQEYVYDGKGYSVNEIGKYLKKYECDYGFIPGMVEKTNALPMSVDDIAYIYKTNKQLTQEDCKILKVGLPDPKEIISDFDFAFYVKSKAEINKTKDEICQKIGGNVTCKFDMEKNCIKLKSDKLEINIKNPSKEPIDSLSPKINNITNLDLLAQRLLFDGAKEHSSKLRWENLFDEIRKAFTVADDYRVKSVGKEITISDETVSREMLEKNLLAMAQKFNAEGKISLFKRFCNPKLNKVYKTVKINNQYLKNKEQCDLVLEYLKVKDQRSSLEPKWNELAGQCNQKLFNDLHNPYPEMACEEIISKHKDYLNWYENDYAKIKYLLKEMGINPEEFQPEVGLITSDDLTMLLNKLTKILPACLELVKKYVDLRNISTKKNSTRLYLQDNKCLNNIISIKLFNNLMQENVNGYTTAYKEYSETYKKYPIFEKRNALLNDLRKYAEDWVQAIEDRQGIHGIEELPGNVVEAWKWKQFEKFYIDISDENIARLQKEVILDSDALRNTTTKLVCTSAWYYLLKKFDNNPSLVESLNAWKQLRGRIGKTRNKKNDELREQSKKVMENCQLAVPAWVMTVDEALTGFDLRRNKFDVIIIDEASQSDLTALPLLYMGAKVIVVGDDKQVSPLAVGVKDEDVLKLAETYLKTFYPKDYRLFDARYSLYDFASLNYKALMLQEHFRCVPDIIGYCNELSYNNKILPLREAGDTAIQPAMVQYRVPNGMRDHRKKINVSEGETIAALFLACLEQPEYKHKTFGVISLLGTEQVDLINRYLYEHIDPRVSEATRLLVGDSATFQGDERDVIFASMVDSSEEIPLRKKGEGQYDAFKKRYNVAVSRAKDQFWVVHSLDYKNCLNKEDLRRNLLEYIDNPKRTDAMKEELRDQADSEFEVMVGYALISRGYNIEPQHAVGSYRIDIVIRNTNIAIECDGEAFHSGDERVRKDMERQTILERLGWKFIRIRGSEYFRHEEECINDVVSQLEEMGAPVHVSPSDNNENRSTPLLEKVKIRANQILKEWHEGKKSTTSADTIFTTPVINHGNTNPRLKVTVNPIRRYDTTKDNWQTVETKDIKPIGNSAPNSKNIRTRKNTDSRRYKKSVFKEELINELGEIGQVVNKSSENGTIWLYGPKCLEGRVNKIAQKYGVNCSFEARGGMQIKGKPAWVITGK